MYYNVQYVFNRFHRMRAQNILYIVFYITTVRRREYYSIVIYEHRFVFIKFHRSAEEISFDKCVFIIFGFLLNGPR